MAFLPAELIEHIVICIRDVPPPKNERSVFQPRGQPAKLALYATVSRRWQTVVERIIWQRIHLLYRKSGSIRLLEQFTSGDPYRRARVDYIRHILWVPEMNWTDLHEGTKGDGNMRAQLLPGWYNEQFQKSLSELFELLHSWRFQKTDMELSISSTAGDYVRDGDDEPLEREEWESLNIDQLWQRGQVPYFIHATDVYFQSLPSLPYITSLKLFGADDSDFRPSTFLRLLTRLSHVQHVCGGEGRSIPKDALKALVDQRQDVVDHLPLVPESVDIFEYKIHYQRELSVNPAQDAANYLSPRGLDEFSIVFRTFSMRLRKLQLEYVRISSALFWPGAGENANPKSLYWPKLEELLVLGVPPFTADGKWILDNDPDKWSNEEINENFHDSWDYESGYYAQRGIIKSPEVDQLYEAMGLAVRRMPRLRKFQFSFRAEVGEGGPDEWLEFHRDLTTGKTCLEMMTRSEYKMGQKIISAWRLKDDKASEFRRTGRVCYSYTT